MKQFLFIALLVVLMYACSRPKILLTGAKENAEVLADSTVYEMETFDNRFERWYEYHRNPSKYRSQSYYESWNEQYVSAWNAKCQYAGKDWNFEPVVGYEFGEDYGFELNHKLFYYFMYVENVLNIPILPGGPKTY